MHKFKKPFIIFFSAIIIFVTLVILFISPITKYLIEKYDEKYTGREITMDFAYVNPFTGYIYFNNLKIYELKSDSIFISTKGISGNVTMRKLFSKTYEIGEFTLNQPRGIFIENKKVFNFDDLVKRFSPEENSDTTAPIHFNILNIKINDGEFYYREKTIPINYSIKKVNIESAGIHWNADTIPAKFSFLSGIGNGDMKGDFTINFKNDDYRFAVVAHKFDCNIIEQYLKDLTNYGSLSANIDADMKASGKFNDEENITASGLMAINDFHFGKNPKDDYASFDKLMLKINEVSPKNYVYLFDSASLIHPYFKYERYDYLDNLEMMFGQKGANVKAVKANPEKFNLVIEIGDYIKTLSKNFFRSDYKINSLKIYEGDFKFNDYSISEKFSIDLNPLTVIADSIDKNNKRINFSLKSGIQPYGNVSAALSINPKDSSDFDMHYHLQKLSAAMFNPYIISYTSFPLDRGTLELKGIWNVRNGNIQSDNHLLLLDPRVTKRLRNRDTKWIPMPLVLAFVRERGNVIDYKIPITGNLKNPKFHWRDVIIHLLENIFVKPPTTPYRMEVKNIETEIEKSLSLNWRMRQSSMTPVQEKFIEKMANFLEENPKAIIDIYPQEYAIKEKEYILFFEAKKKYFLKINDKNIQDFSNEDSIIVDKMSVKDSLFVHYLNKQINKSMIFTIQEKCARLIDISIVDAKYKQLEKERLNTFMSYFKKREVEKQIKFSKSENVIPYNGFSFYKIKYKGQFPESLLKAFRKMNELNEEPPRKKYENERKKIRSLLREKK